MSAFAVSQFTLRFISLRMSRSTFADMTSSAATGAPTAVRKSAMASDCFMYVT